MSKLPPLNYQHQINGAISALPVGKVVCIGRNYAAHAKELNNPVPKSPILFIKPNTSLVPLSGEIQLPVGRGECHFETELAILIGDRLTEASASESENAIAGVGVALDLTLRGLQSELKAKGHPWEKAKAFDGACPVSGFVAFDGDLQSLAFFLDINGRRQQSGNPRDMLTPVLELLSYASHHFTLLPGDVVLTGTPEGVGVLNTGDRLSLGVTDLLTAEAEVV